MPTNVNNNRPAPTATPTTPTTPTTPAPVVFDDAEALVTTAPPAATFESAPKKPAPFGPPASPTLTDERTAKTADELEQVRDTNSERIKGYNKAYGDYLATYADAVKSAPNLDRVRCFGPPVDYAPASSLPVAQRAQYDGLHKPALANAKAVHEVLGERVMRESGQKLPGGYAFADVKATVFGNGVKGRVSIDDQGEVKTKSSTQVGLNSKLLEPDLKIKGTKVGLGVTTNIDNETGKVTNALQVKVGAIGIEADDHGKVATEIGMDVGHGEVKGSVKGGSSYDGKNRKAEVYAKVGAKFGEGELEAKLGVGVQFLTDEYVERVIDPNAPGFFDDPFDRTKLLGGR